MGRGLDGKYIMEVLAMGGRERQVPWLCWVVGDSSHECTAQTGQESMWQYYSNDIHMFILCTYK
jgi:hypothetical protein